MKKFYATLTIITFALVSAFSQRHTDIQVTEVSPSQGMTIKSGVPIDLIIKLKNLGPATLKVSDTLWFLPLLDNNYFTSNGNVVIFGRILSADLASGSEISMTLVTNLNFNWTSSQNGAHSFCILGWIQNHSADSTHDDNLNNDKGCQIVYLDPYAAGIATGGLTVSSAAVYPNPAVNSTSVIYSVSTPSNVSVKIKDINGKEVMNVGNGFREAGEYTEDVNTSMLSPGIYFTEVQIGENVINKKLMIVK